MSFVNFILPDSNFIKQPIKQEISFRQLNPNLNTYIPYEFLLIYDDTQKQVISKFENLKFERTYRIINALEVLKIITNQEEQLKNFKENSTEINEKNKLLQNLQNEIESLKNQLKQKEEGQASQIKQQEEIIKKQNSDTNTDICKTANQGSITKSDQIHNSIPSKPSNAPKQTDLLYELLNRKEAQLERAGLNQALQNASHQNEIDRLKETIQSLKLQYQQEKDLILQKDMDNLKLQHQMEIENEILKMKLQNAENESNRIKEKSEKQQSKLSSLKNSLSRQGSTSQFDLESPLQSKQLGLEKELGALTEMHRQQNQELQKVKIENGVLTNENQDLKNSLDILNKQQQGQVLGLQNENNKLKEEINIINQKIQEQDRIISMQKEQLNKLYKSSSNYLYRLIRQVELVPKAYFPDLKFALNNLNEQDFQPLPQEIEAQYTVYETSWNQKEVESVIFQNSNLDFTEDIAIKKIGVVEGSIISKVRATTQFKNCNEEIFDSISLFQAKKFTSLEQPQQLKIFALKTYQHQVVDENTLINPFYGNTKEEALKTVSNMIAAQTIINSFQQELEKYGHHIEFKFEFTKFLIFSGEVSFKLFFLLSSEHRDQKRNQNQQENNPNEKQLKYVSKQNDNKDDEKKDNDDEINENQENQISDTVGNELLHQRGYKFLKDFIKQQDDDNSNKFIQFIRDQIMIKRVEQGQNKKSLIELELKDLQDYQINNNLNDYTCQEIQEGFHLLQNELQHYPTHFPFQQYYPAYEVKFDYTKKNKIIQHNGSNLADNPENSFYSALSYYSIVKSNSQFCLSYLQRIDDHFYEPLISTYDGLFSCLDQGRRQISNIESKFLTSKHYLEWKDFFDKVKNNPIQ